jgi:hypothetical protein
MKPVRNVPASVRQKLLNHARNEKRPFNELLQYYAMERFLFFDIWLLSRQFDFEGPKLAEAIRLTFEQRETPLPTEMEIVTPSFIEAKQVQWAAFKRRLHQEHIPDSFGDIAKGIEGFLWPVVRAVSSGRSIPKTWIAPGPWS